MDNTNYIGMDVHKETISIAVLNSTGNLLRPHVREVLVCDPRKNASLKMGNKSDRIDARKPAELLYMNKLSSVYHGEHGVRALKELSRSYLANSGDLARVMTHLKAVYRSWAIACAGKQV
jgi:hypothetical protein